MKFFNPKKLAGKQGGDNNRIGLFSLLVVLVVVMSALVGLVVVNTSNNAKQTVARQSQEYENEKNKNQDAAQNQDNQPTDTQDEAELAQTSDKRITLTVAVYYPKYSETDDEDGNGLGSVQRPVYEGQQALDVAISEIIAGPASAEKAEGYFGGIELTGDSRCEGQDYKLESTDQGLKLQFCREVKTAVESAKEKLKEQITRTLGEISGQTTIIILDQDGECLFKDKSGNCQ